MKKKVHKLLIICQNMVTIVVNKNRKEKDK